MASSVPGSVSMITFLGAEAGAGSTDAARAGGADETKRNAQSATAEAKRTFRSTLRAPGVPTERRDLRNARKSGECEDTNRSAKTNDT
jgi:hypothetical protein